MKLTNSFRDAAQIRQARGLDAFRSREEEENLRAWERVVEIANELGKCSDSAAVRAMKELQELAHKRLSFADELGFSEQEMESCETASGMIVAQRALHLHPRARAWLQVLPALWVLIARQRR